MKNKLLLLAVVVIAGALLYYCFNTGSKSEDVSAAAGETYKLEYTPTLQAYGFTEPVVLKAKPQRVVSLVHTPVLTLHEMGIKQVAVPQAAMLEWPADLVKDAKLLNVSMNSNFDIESVIALEPDLVIVGYQSKDTYGKILDREKIPVYYVDAGHVVSYESIKELTDVLIKAFGQHNAGAEAITDRFNKLEARMAEKRQENKGQKVMVLQSAPPRHYIQGKDGTLGSMLDMLGYENVYQNNKMVLIDLEQALKKNRERDIRMKSTSVGPHRDDLCFLSGDLDIRKFGSQGQQRTAALSLKLSEIELVKEVIKDTPILLLDEVLSELDKHRQNYLLDSIHDIQTLITCTGVDEFVNHRFEVNKVFHVQNGQVIKEN